MVSSAFTATSAIAGSIPRSLRFTTVTVLLLMLVLMTGDIVIWAHGQMSWIRLVIVLGSEILVVGGWLLWEMRSGRYAQPSLERPTRWFLHHLRRLPLLIVGFYVVTYGLRYLAFAAHGWRYGMLNLGFLVETVKISLLYPCWLGLVFGFQSFREMREQNERLLNAQRSLAEAQLTQLRAQLRPHFLFNALNTISATMQTDVSQADRLLTLLGDMLRSNLETTDSHFVSLEEELDLLRRYADIMQARFGERVTMQWQIAEDALKITIPSMLLQPLLENSFKHGVECSSTIQTVQIRAECIAADLQIVIYNSGPQLALPYREGLGTRSCRERLALLYGDAGSFSLRDHPDGGVEARIVVPVQRTEST